MPGFGWEDYRCLLLKTHLTILIIESDGSIEHKNHKSQAPNRK